MTTIIATLGGTNIYRSFDATGEKVFWTGKQDVDNDGSGGNVEPDEPRKDPCHQNDTSLHDPQGKALNAQTVPFVVVPPQVCEQTTGHVLGSLAFASYKGKTVNAVVGDIGPRNKVGEGSVRLAQLLGIPDSPIDGGVDSGVAVMIMVGVPAVIDGVKYNLKSYR